MTGYQRAGQADVQTRHVATQCGEHLRAAAGHVR